jgi:hypothetical protein
MLDQSPLTLHFFFLHRTSFSNLIPSHPVQNRAMSGFDQFFRPLRRSGGEGDETSSEEQSDAVAAIKPEKDHPTYITPDLLRRHAR